MPTPRQRLPTISAARAGIGPVCYDLTGKTRPTEFKTCKDALHFLVTYKRAKS